MSSDLDPLLKTLNLANTRKSWQLLVARAEKEDWPYDQFLQVLLSEELAHRRATRLAKASRAADFPFLRTIEEFDFTFQSTLRLASIGSLLSPDFVIEGRSVILFGRPGRGKTHLAIAIAYRAIQCGFEALFTTAAEMIEDLSTASRDGRLREALVRYVRPHVLIVDEVGYLSYGPDAANVLYHVVNERHVRKRAMIFTTNKDPKRQWGAVLHDDDLAEAIVDRILERGRLLRLDGPSVRTNHLPPDELAADDKVTSSSSRVSGRTAAEFPEPTAAALVMRASVGLSRNSRHPDTHPAAASQPNAWHPTGLSFEPRRTARRQSRRRTGSAHGKPTLAVGGQPTPDRLARRLTGSNRPPAYPGSPG
jgi:DNA replication protein DnaC